VHENDKDGSEEEPVLVNIGGEAFGRHGWGRGR
jgi:hypothetical protein